MIPNSILITFSTKDDFNDHNDQDDDDDDIGGLFKIVTSEQNRTNKLTSGHDDIDCSKFAWSNLHDWNKEDMRDLIK